MRLRCFWLLLRLRCCIDTGCQTCGVLELQDGSTERNYHFGEHKLLAVVQVLKHKRHYLEGAVR